MAQQQRWARNSDDWPEVDCLLSGRQRGGPDADDGPVLRQQPTKAAVEAATPVARGRH